MTERSTYWPGATLGMDCGDVAPIRSPLSNTIEYPDHVQAPAFLNRQVLVNEEFGGICDPSGIVMSRTNCAWSQTAVAVAAGGRVEAGGKVGKEADVLGATAAGRVGVLKLSAAVGVS